MAQQAIEPETEGEMETYTFYPPQLRYTQMPYQVIAPGAANCEHELFELDWCDRIFIQDGLVFVTFSCRHCGRQICQALDEVMPPASWKGGSNDRKTPQIANTVLVTA